MLNARDWNDSSKPFFLWLTQSRHDDTDVIFISQHSHNIDKQIARLVTYISRVRNMRNFSFPGIGRWPFKQFVVNRFDQDGKTLLDRKWHWHDAAIFKCYRSKVMRGAHKRLSSVGVPRRQLKTSNPKRPMAKVILVIVLCLAVFGISKFMSSPTLNSWGKTDASKPSPTPRPSPTLSKQPNSAPPKKWDIFTERFRMQTGPYIVRTDTGYHEVGRMSIHGMVIGIRDRVVRVDQADGRIGFIVCEDETQQIPTSIPSAALAVPAQISSPVTVATSTPSPKIPNPMPEHVARVWRGRQGVREDGSAAPGI